MSGLSVRRLQAERKKRRRPAGLTSSDVSEMTPGGETGVGWGAGWVSVEEHETQEARAASSGSGKAGVPKRSVARAAWRFPLAGECWAA